MSTTSPSSGSGREPTLEQRIHMTDSFGKFLHNASLAMLVGAPILIALPPRKLDLYTFFLTGAFVTSANHLVKERTGAGLLYQLPGVRLPPKAIEFQEQQRGRQRHLLDEQVPRETLRPLEHRKPAGLEKAAKDLWMGGESEGWKERRLKEEQEKLDQGEGYGSMILDQIWDVWNQGEKKAEKLKEQDEQVMKSRDEAERARKRELEFPQIGKGQK